MGDDDGAVLRVLIGICAADEVDADEGIAAVCAAYATLTGGATTAEAVTAGREAARSEPDGWLDAVRTLAARLDDDGRAALFDAGFSVAAADGFVLDGEDRILATLAAALGMSEHDYRTALDRLIAAAR
jgi:uncharacterized tellurite resistance protein B-like protein